MSKKAWSGAASMGPTDYFQLLIPRLRGDGRQKKKSTLQFGEKVLTVSRTTSVGRSKQDPQGIGGAKRFSPEQRRPPAPSV